MTPRRVTPAGWSAWMQELARSSRGPFEGPWMPAMDVYRTAHGWLLKMELAGVRKEDVSVRIEGRRITFEGVRRDRTVEERPECHSLEICYSRFSRSVELPADLGRLRLSTDYEDGMLVVRLSEEGAG